MSNDEISPQLQEIHDAIFQRKRDKAIEMYSRYAMVNWDEAEQVISRLELELIKSDREKFKPKTNWSVIFSLIGIAIVLIMCLALLFRALRLLGKTF